MISEGKQEVFIFQLFEKEMRFNIEIFHSLWKYELFAIKKQTHTMYL